MENRRLLSLGNHLKVEPYILIDFKLKHLLLHLECAATLSVLEYTQDNELTSTVGVHCSELRLLADHLAENLYFIDARVSRLWYFLERHHCDNNKDETFVVEANKQAILNFVCLADREENIRNISLLFQHLQ